MRNRFLDKRMPSFLGIIFLGLSIGLFLWFGQNFTGLRSRANTGEVPKNVKITNITDSSFTVSYLTDIKTTGVIVYGETNKLGSVAFDEREAGADSIIERRTHQMTVKGLDANKVYYFAIQSGAATYMDGDRAYEVSTAVEGLAMGEKKILRGKIILVDGGIPIEGIVYVFGENSSFMSSVLRQDGSYEIVISSLRKADLSGYFDFSKSIVLQMLVTNGEVESEISLTPDFVSQVPLIILSKNYDFLGSGISSVNLDASGSAERLPEASISAMPSDFPQFSTEIASGPAITIPSAENSKFIDQQPMFEGMALPNASVLIKIESNVPIEAQVVADSNGGWSFRPADPLVPGEHVITISTNDSKGVLQIISRSFTVHASGSQFNEPSVSPANVTPIMTITITPTVQPIPTSTPTIIVTPVIVASATPSLGLTITQAISATPTVDPNRFSLTPTIPPSGSISIGIIGLVMMGIVGIGLFMFAL